MKRRTGPGQGTRKRPKQGRPEATATAISRANQVLQVLGNVVHHITQIGLNRCAVFITMLDHNKPNPALYLPCCFSQILSAS